MAGELQEYPNRSLHKGINTRLNARLIDDYSATELLNADITTVGIRTKKPSPNDVACLLFPPTLTAVGSPTAITLTLTWDFSMVPGSSTVIERSTNQFTWAEIAEVDYPTATYTDTGLVNDTDYYYRLRPRDGCTGAVSSVVKGTTTTCNATGLCLATQFNMHCAGSAGTCAPYCGDMGDTISMEESYVELNKTLPGGTGLALQAGESCRFYGVGGYSLESHDFGCNDISTGIINYGFQVCFIVFSNRIEVWYEDLNVGGNIITVYRLEATLALGCGLTYEIPGGITLSRCSNATSLGKTGAITITRIS